MKPYRETSKCLFFLSAAFGPEWRPALLNSRWDYENIVDAFLQRALYAGSIDVWVNGSFNENPTDFSQRHTIDEYMPKNPGIFFLLVKCYVPRIKAHYFSL